MSSEQKNPSSSSEHEKKNEGGREFGHSHKPSQTQQASRNQGLADNQSGQQGGSSSGSHQGSSSQQGSQQGRPPGSSQEHKKENQSERKSA
jgi:hypothetical protein